MAIKSTVQIGDPVIRARAKRVADPLSAQTKRIVRDLIDSMRADNLVGMAAPQIGESVRIFVSEIRSTVYREKSEKEIDSIRVFINPVIVEKSSKLATDFEGCGSVAQAGLFGKVPRPAKVTIRAQDSNGDMFEGVATGLLARIIQHEMDHLDGKVFLDRMKDMKTLEGKQQYIAKNGKKNKAK